MQNRDILKEGFEKLHNEVCQRSGIEHKFNYDDNCKRRINRLFREIGMKRIPYPEMDNRIERIKFRLFFVKQWLKRLFRRILKPKSSRL